MAVHENFSPFNSKNIIKASSPKQQLIVNIHINAKGDTQEMKIRNINDMNLINKQITKFIKDHSLKEKAFDFIKEHILTQVRNRNKSPSHKKFIKKCQQSNCKCSKNKQRFQQKQQIMSLLTPRNNQTLNTPRKKSHTTRNEASPIHIGIKINKSIDAKKQALKTKQNTEQNVFNASFTLPSTVGEKDKALLADYNLQNTFHNPQSWKKSCQFTNLSQFNTLKQKNLAFNPNVKVAKFLSEVNMKQNKDNKIERRLNMTFKQRIKLSHKQNNKNVDKNQQKHMTTRQRKQAIMKIKMPAHKQQNNKSYREFDAQNLQDQVNKHFQQIKSKTIKQNIENPIIFSPKCISDKSQHIIKTFFQKLTESNPKDCLQMNQNYIDYSRLSSNQLKFLSVFLQKIDHKQLNNLNYEHFVSNVIKYCLPEVTTYLIDENLGSGRLKQQHYFYFD